MAQPRRRGASLRAFAAPAAGRPQVWRLVVGLVLALVVYAAWIAALLGALLVLFGRESARGWIVDLARAQTPAGALLLLLTFVGLGAGAMLAARLLHRRPAKSLFGPAPTVVRDFVAALLVVAVVYGVAGAIWSSGYDTVANLPPGLWLALLPLGLIGLLVQTGAEELLFRGYVLQQLAARFASPAVWLVLPSVAFGLVHYDPATAGDNVWIVVAQATVFGLVAADLTAATGSLGAAWGFHFANNAVAILALATKGTITGLALRLTPYSLGEAQIGAGVVAGDLATMLAAWLGVRFLLRR